MARAEGVDVEDLDFRGEPVTTVSLLLLGSTAAVSTVLYLIDKIKGGQVIDLREGAPRPFYRTKDLVYGLVTIISSDGRILVEVKEPRGMLGPVMDALKDIVSDLAKASAGAVADRVRQAVGDKADVRLD